MTGEKATVAHARARKRGPQLGAVSRALERRGGESARCGERGQVFVLTAIIIPLVLLLGTIAVDVGNWWVHRKHLQTLVDAGALAAAPKFVGC